MDKMVRTLFVEKIRREIGNGGFKYCEYTGANYIFEWCMAFTSYAMREIAGLGNSFPLHTSCTRFLNSPLGTRIRNKDFKTAEVGDIIEFELDGVQSDMEHVGIVIETGKDFITLIEGNTNGSNCKETTVNTFRYKKDNASFGWIFDMSDFFCDSYTQVEHNDELIEHETEKLLEMLTYVTNTCDEIKSLSSEIQKLSDGISLSLNKLHP